VNFVHRFELVDVHAEVCAALMPRDPHGRELGRDLLGRELLLTAGGVV
jgi:hypothetical protein